MSRAVVYFSGDVVTTGLLFAVSGAAPEFAVAVAVAVCAVAAEQIVSNNFYTQIQNLHHISSKQEMVIPPLSVAAAAAAAPLTSVASAAPRAAGSVTDAQTPSPSGLP